jgi:hypothetical protein
MMRRAFHWLYVLTTSALSAATPPSGAMPADSDFRGGRVGWARLVTPSVHWRRHAQADPTLSNFIRAETSLNMDPQWYSADPADVKQLGVYPLIYTNNLTDVRDRRQRSNIQEYLRRGGFMVIDSCINLSVTSDPDRFLAQHTALFGELLPEAQVRPLPATHAIYRQYFPMRETPPHSYFQQRYDPKWARHGLYGVFEGDRMFALVSLSGLQCGWDKFGPPGHDKECMKMLVNIYVYAMTR